MAVSNHAVYATQPRPLRDQISRLLKNVQQDATDGQITAVVVPDTNQLEGGSAAASVYGALQGRSYDTVIVISASHSGSFGRISVCDVDTYRTPFGDLAVNDRIRNELCDEDDDIFIDDRGHFHTDGIDVQLPFLQMAIDGPFDIVPIVMGEETPDFCRELGTAIGEVAYNHRVLVVSSANILAADGDRLEALREYLQQGDVHRLMSLLNSESVHVKGKGPLLVALIAALHMNSDRISILTLQPPENDMPGFIGTIMTRR